MMDSNDTAEVGNDKITDESTSSVNTSRAGSPVLDAVDLPVVSEPQVTVSDCYSDSDSDSEDDKNGATVAPLPDAPLPDAPLPDAPLPDAPLPDAPLEESGKHEGKTVRFAPTDSEDDNATITNEFLTDDAVVTTDAKTPSWFNWALFNIELTPRNMALMLLAGGLFVATVGLIAASAPAVVTGLAAAGVGFAMLGGTGFFCGRNASRAATDEASFAATDEASAAVALN